MRLQARRGWRRRCGRRRNRHGVSAPPRRRRRAGSGQSIFARRGKGAVDLRFEQNVVRAADHDQMLDVVATDKNKLPLAIEAEGVDQPKSGLARSSPWDAQPVGEHKPVDNRQRHQGGDPASRQKSDLRDRIAGERKVTQPLHADSRACAADRASLITPSCAPQVPADLRAQTAFLEKLHGHPGRL
jgi:hypothetical protein